MSRVPDLDEFLDDEDPEWLDDDMPDDDWDWGYLAGEESERKRIIKLLSEAGFSMALERREGDSAIWNGEKWIELSGGEQK